MPFLFFLTLNLSVPLYLRLKQPSVPLYARAIGFIEDLFVALELFLLTVISVKAAAVLGFLIHLVLMLDSTLFKQMQLRLRFSYLIHLKHANTYYSSAKELGLKDLIRGAFAILALHTAGYFMVYRHFQGAISLIDGAIIAGIGALAFLCARWMPKKLAYAVNNLFFVEQMRFFQIREKKPTVSSLTFPLESFHLLDENYPLWRITKSFQGEKQFEVKIDAEEKPHVILLFLESFSSHSIGYEKKATPHFDRLSQEGILFSNFYSNGTFTYRALLGGLFGISGGNTKKGLAPYVNIPFVGLPQLMKQAGYTSAFFHNGSLNFDKQREFLKNHFDLLADRHEIEDSPKTSTSWGAHDECLMRYTVDWLEKQQKPAFMTLFTISNHHPWITPEHHIPPVFESFLNASHQRFLQTMHYTDHSLGLLMELLREKNLSKKTVVVMVGDHSQPLGQHHGNFYYSRFLYEENVRVPLLIIADGRILQPKTVEEVGSHVDLLPTLMDLLRLQGVQQGCGTSLLRKHPDRTAMLHNPYSEGFLGCRKGPWKWIENQLTLEGELYDLTADPQEKNNQVAAYPEVAESLRLEARNYFQYIYTLHQQQKIVPSEEGYCPPSALSFDFSTTMITDNELIQLASECPQMEKLNLRDCLLITDEAVAMILSKCTHLEELNLKGITDVTDKAFERGLEASRERLRALHMCSMPISDQGLEKLVRACPNLSVLSLQGKNLTNQGIQTLARCRHLVRLKILQADNASEDALIHILSNNPHLGHLVVQGCPTLTDRVLEALQAHPLELLWIFDAPLLTDAGIAYLGKLPIRFLTLEGCPLLTDKCIPYLSQLNLESAYLNCQEMMKVHL
jgi:phosphoglycerol transferase MdoB-like AlkP superfamily enzyme